MNHLIAIVNMTDGSVQAHKAGCKDLSRKSRKGVGFADEAWELEVTDREEAREAYNADFDEETDGWYDIEWLPCASHVPDREEAEEATVETTIKVCGKWTRFYQNGVEVGRVHNDAADAVFAVIRQG
jgi:hypothetical protein